MKASDLRVNNVISANYFMYRVLNVFADGTIQGLSMGPDGAVYPDTLYSITELSGVCITDDRLKMLGFTYHKSEQCIYFARSWGKNGVEIITKDFPNKGYFFELGAHRHKLVEFIHEVQNTFHVLTGSDLIFTADKPTSEGEKIKSASGHGAQHVS